MGTYIYTITSVNNNYSFRVEGYNIWNALKNANLIPTDVETLTNKYMSGTPFNKRKRNITAFYNIAGTFPNPRNFIVEQRKK